MAANIEDTGSSDAVGSSSNIDALDARIYRTSIKSRSKASIYKRAILPNGLLHQHLREKLQPPILGVQEPEITFNKKIF